MPDAPDDAAGVRCMVIVDIRDLAVPSTITVPIGAFFQMPSFEGHRDNKRRAAKAYHLHVFQPDHVRCEAGIITTDGKLPHDLLNVIGANPKGVVRFTGNTRAHCWEFGLTDRVPSHVILDVYPCRDEAHVQELGTHFDSPAAAWTRHDHDYRAMGLAFKEEWRPRSRAGKNGAFGGAARQADAYVYGVHHAETAVHTADIMPRWGREIPILDVLCDVPVAESLPQEFKPTRVGVMAAVLLLLRYEDSEQVAAWWRSAQQDEGTKDSYGLDGVQSLVEVIKSVPSDKGGRKKLGRSSVAYNTELARRVIGAYLLHRDGKRVIRPLSVRVDPVEYCKKRQKSEAWVLKTPRLTDADEREAA